MMHAPASPPELNSSKSSKSSSSLPSSAFNEHDGIISDFSNFEEIGLEDDDEPISHFNTSLDRSAKFPRTRIGSLPFRELANTRQFDTSSRPPRPSLITEQKAYPIGHPWHSTPAIRGARSRSPSPAPRYGSPTSTTSTGALTRRTPPHRLASLTVDSLPIRKTRKTAAELEEECQDSGDDDVPDDVVFWNVPISPVPPDPQRTPRPHDDHEASKSSLTLTVPTEDASRPDARNNSRRPLSSPTLGQHPKHEGGNRPKGFYSLSRNGSVGTFPLSPIPLDALPKSRSHSWSAAMDQLSAEAQVLTEILEMHQSPSNASLASINSKSSWQSHSASRSSVASIASVELPPLRKMNVMIDPLPPSKEKLTVLTRTRPSWLPPKSKTEERKHLREYEKMVLASQMTLKKRQEKEREEAEQADRLRTNLARVWEELVIPNWDKVITEPRTRELWWRGVASKARGTVWKRAIGNDLGLTQDSFYAALRRSRDLQVLLSREEATSPILDEATRKHQSLLFSKIDQDVVQTYPHLNLFQYPYPLSDQLLDVLHAYTSYVPTHPYRTSLCHIVAIISLHLPPAETFIAVANLLNRRLPIAFSTSDSPALSRVYELTLKALHYKLPQLVSHLENTLHIAPSSYLAPIFTSLFTLNFDIETTQRIFDVYVFELDPFLIRCAVGVMTILESRLYGSREEIISIVSGPNLWTEKGENEVMNIIRSAGKEDKKKSDEE